MISESVATYPVEYLPTGDHALLVAWSAVPPVFVLGGGSISPEDAAILMNRLRTNTEPRAILCLEDGRAVLATLSEFKFDYRYDASRGGFVDVSGFAIEEDPDVEPDQKPADHGGEAVPGLVPEPD